MPFVEGRVDVEDANALTEETVFADVCSILFIDSSVRERVSVLHMYTAAVSRRARQVNQRLDKSLLLSCSASSLKSSQGMPARDGVSFQPGILLT